MTLLILGEPAGNYEETHPDWVPTRYIGYKSTPGSLDRYLRQQKRQQRFKQPVTKRRKEQDEDTRYSRVVVVAKCFLCIIRH